MDRLGSEASPALVAGRDIYRTLSGLTERCVMSDQVLSM